MFENYLASKEDLSAINEALSYAWHPKMNFVFKDKELRKRRFCIRAH